MPGSKISTTVTNTVTIGSQAYPSPLTITATGAIAPTAYSANGVYAGSGLSGLRLINHGTITAGRGAYSQNYDGGSGGLGADLQSAATVTNTGLIAAGAGGASDQANGGRGGIGIDLALGGKLINNGSIIGGYGGYSRQANGGAGSAAVYQNGGALTNNGSIAGGFGGGASYGFGGYGGDAGAGVVFAGSGKITNSGVISGGDGGYSQYHFAADGAAGVVLRASSTVTNTGSILGGTGGGSFYGSPGRGGYGVRMLRGGVLNNQAAIAGGNGYSGFYNGSSGGAGVALDAGGTVSNSGTIRGGNANGGFYDAGDGGAGIVLTSGGMVSNTGLIVGGAGGSSGYYAGVGGIGVDIANGGNVVNSGTIQGGNGGKGSYYYPGAAGVYLNGGTLTNAGTISAGLSGGYLANSIQFGSLAATLVVDPGAVFIGNIVANSNVDDELLLGGSGAGTLHKIGTHFIGFTTLAVQAGATWTLTAPNTLGAGTSLLDDGSLSVAGTLNDQGSASVSARAILQTAQNGTIQIDNVIMSGGTLSTTRSGIFAVGPTLAGDDTGQITVDTGATLAGNGSITSTLVDNGAIIAQGGTLKLTQAVSGSGALTIDTGGSVAAHASLAVASVVFASGDDETLQGGPSEITGVISGFGSGDVIDIRPVTATTLSFLSGTLTLLDGNTVVDELFLAGSYDTADFALSPDGHGGTDIEFATQGAAPRDNAELPSRWGWFGYHEAEAPYGGFVTNFVPHGV